MEELGRVFRTTRENQNLTLDEIQERTKIRKRYLQAIEDGDLSILPGLVYARGFIKSYAEVLGLDGQALLHEYSLMPEKVEEEPQKPVPSKSAPTHSKPVADKRSGSLPQVLVGIAVIGLLGVGYWGLLARDEKPNIPPAADKQTSTGQNNQQTPAPPVQPPQETKSNEPLKPESKTEKQSIYKVQASNLKIAIDAANDNCWMEVWVDGQKQLSQLVTKGTLLSYEGTKEIVLISGNAPALSVKVNDRPIELEQVTERYEFHFQQQ